VCAVSFKVHWSQKGHEEIIQHFFPDAALLKALALLYLLCQKSTLLLLLGPEDGGTILRNVISYLTVG
jgi:hypothetical protein